MENISDYLGSDHKRCDDLFAAAETCVTKNDWDAAEIAMKAFSDSIEHHFAMEEMVLFPEFESAIGSSEGPTSVMRADHRQIRAILADLNDALAARDANTFLGCADTLNIMVQQHNMKEESILYPMTDRVLSQQRDETITAMREIGALQ